MKRGLFIWMAVAAASAFAVACGGDKDTVPPSIAINEPEPGDSLKPGSTLHFEASLTDDVMLRSCKVDIHWGGDHNHSKAAADSTWSVQRTFDLSGSRNKLLHEHFDIPVNAKEGHYHLVTYCTDEAGNEAVVFVTFVLSNEARAHEHD